MSLGAGFSQLSEASRLWFAEVSLAFGGNFITSTKGQKLRPEL